MAIKFIIEKPCGEDWNAMTPEAQGRFCASCTKCVFDFTKKSDEEILNTYKAQGGRVCGRFRKEQLSRPAQGHVSRGLRLFAAAFLLIFSLGMSGCAPKDHVMGEVEMGIVTVDDSVYQPVDSVPPDNIHHAPDDGR